ncbi:hypothetical protein INT43_004551, partial [Umbelopsis isabellina]
TTVDSVHAITLSFAMTAITKVLIANRGEIACRVITTCHRMGIATVAVFSDSDANGRFVKMADQACHLGGSLASESYLRGDKIIEVAKLTGANAIHPGYGFLSENAEFAEKVTQAGIIFIGPTPESIRILGDKISAKRYLAEHAPKVPVIPGYNGDDQSVETLKKAALGIEFPVLLKASAGGGGKGMRTVYKAENLQSEIEAAKGESLRAFGSEQLLIEKYFTSVRHVEVQIFGDQYGNIYHINERDCSIQRRHQKIVEETPCPQMTEELRYSMTAAALEIGRKLAYVGAGTVEFILDAKTNKFYFLEVNTRLQVEHGITEAISGLDLVELQILVAQGENLRKVPGINQLQFQGHAIECRICAEDPGNDFAPVTGKILKWRQIDHARQLPGVRYDTGFEDGSEITIYYDSMIAKLIVHAPTRKQAITTMALVLSQTVILGIVTNQKFLLNIMKNQRFQSGVYDTGFIGLEIDNLVPALTNVEEDRLALVGFMFDWAMRNAQRSALRNIPGGWRNNSRTKFPQKLIVEDQDVLELEYEHQLQGSNQHKFVFGVSRGEEKQESNREAILQSVSLDQGQLQAPGQHMVTGVLTCTIGKVLRACQHGLREQFFVADSPSGINDRTMYVHTASYGSQVKVVKQDRLKSANQEDDSDNVSPYTSPMPCRILKVLAPTGTKVKKNDPILTVESMKTEVKLLSRHDGLVTIKVEEGQMVDARVVLCLVE